MKRLFPQRGFTLLELLVVISILGILMAMGAVAFSTAQKKGRDAKRHGDMKAIQSAFEQRYAEIGGYGTGATGTGNFLNCSHLSTQMSGGLPTDPKTSTYSCSGGASTYCSCALMENTGTGNASNATCTYATGGDYFCVSQLQ